MAKANPATWAKARAMFEADKSFRYIAKNCPPLDSSNIAKVAKKEGWQRGLLPQLIIDKARVEAESARIDAEFTTLLPQQQALVVKEVNERNKHIQILNNMTLKNLAVMNKKVNEDFEMTEHKLFQETVNKASEQLLGKEPQTVFNNTNAQQTVFEPIRFTRAAG